MRARGAEDRLYREFLRVPDLSAGLYVLEAGATDPSRPTPRTSSTTSSRGRGSVTVGDETREVTSGLAGVRRRRPCRIGSTTSSERLELLVVFGPAEDTRG